MPRPCQLLPEQAIFNLVIEHLNVPVKFVDNRWNRVVHPEGPDQNAYINHFAGEAKHMIAGSNWKKEPPPATDLMTVVFPTDPQYPPSDVLNAAQLIQNWAEQNGHKYWQLGGICDRRFSTTPKP